MEAICCHRNQSPDPIWTKTQCSLSLTPNLVAFGLLVLDIYMKVRTDGHTDGRTPARPVYYKLIVISGQILPKRKRGVE